MVKVRIEYEGQVREFEGSAIAAFIPFSDDGEVYWVLAGETSADEMAKVLSAGIPRILERASKNRTEYIDAMVEVYKRFEEKIKEELRTRGANVLIDALAKAMEEELEK